MCDDEPECDGGYKFATVSNITNIVLESDVKEFIGMNIAVVSAILDEIRYKRIEEEKKYGQGHK